MIRNMFLSTVKKLVACRIVDTVLLRQLFWLSCQRMGCECFHHAPQLSKQSHWSVKLLRLQNFYFLLWNSQKRPFIRVQAKESITFAATNSRLGSAPLVLVSLGELRTDQHWQLPSNLVDLVGMGFEFCSCFTDVGVLFPVGLSCLVRSCYLRPSFLRCQAGTPWRPSPFRGRFWAGIKDVLNPAAVARSECDKMWNHSDRPLSGPRR